jgi:hypothetical protein
MDFRRFLKLALAVFVTAGLALAPLVAPAAAKGPSMEMTDMSAISADMPCCPDGQKSKDCQDCPLVAMCVLKTSQAGPSMTFAMPVRHAIRAAHSVLDDAPADGLDHPPPDQPPRILA